MAEPITCDVHNREHPADVLVSQLANGETFAACMDGYVESARALVALADQAEADANDAPVLDRLAGVTAPADQGEAAGELEPAAGDDDVEPGAAPPTSAESSDVAPAPAGAPTRPARGRASAEAATDATPGAAVAPGGSEAGVGDPGEAAPVA